MCVLGNMLELFFGSLWWPHWASTLPKAQPKRQDIEVQKLCGSITVSCALVLTETSFSLFWEVTKLLVFQHFSWGMLVASQFVPSGFITTGIEQIVIQYGTLFRHSHQECGPLWGTYWSHRANLPPLWYAAASRTTTTSCLIQIGTPI